MLKNDFTRKMIDFDNFKKLPKNVGDLGKLKSCPMSNKSPNLVTLPTTQELFITVVGNMPIRWNGNFTYCVRLNIKFKFIFVFCGTRSIYLRKIVNFISVNLYIFAILTVLLSQEITVYIPLFELFELKHFLNSSSLK